VGLCTRRFALPGILEPSTRAALGFVVTVAGLLQGAVPTGPNVGERVPDFVLRDQDGHEKTLRSIMGPKGALLVFYRSADWWPFCKAQLVELEQNRARISAQGLGLAAVSYDSIAILKAFADREHIGFELLSDPESRLIRTYGILNSTVARDSPYFGIPHPGTYVLDAAGVVIAKYFEDDFRVRDTAASILLRQFGVEPAPREKVQAKHLQLDTSGGDLPLRPNQRASLAVDVRLPDRVHVYAPGVTGYIPIALAMRSSPAFQSDPVSYPAPKTMRLEAIHETVPVYDRSLRLVETITLAGAQQVEPLLDADRNLTIEGDLRYQACDDRECFVPETVRLKWTVHVLPFDRTRAPQPLRRKQ
jgi:peroxiredoxin